MATLSVRCRDCGAAIQAEGEQIDTELSRRGWSISHGQTFCPSCAATRGLSAAGPTGQPPLGTLADTVTAAPPALSGTVASPLGVRAACRVIRARLERAPAARLEPSFAAPRETVAGFVIARRVYAFRWVGPVGPIMPLPPYPPSLRGRVIALPDGGSELHWRIRPQPFGSRLARVFEIVVLPLLAVAAFAHFLASGSSGGLIVATILATLIAAILAAPVVFRGRLQDYGVQPLADWIAALSPELTDPRPTPPASQPSRAGPDCTIVGAANGPDAEVTSEGRRGKHPGVRVRRSRALRSRPCQRAHGPRLGARPADLHRPPAPRACTPGQNRNLAALLSMICPATDILKP